MKRGVNLRLSTFADFSNPCDQANLTAEELEKKAMPTAEKAINEEGET